MKNERQTKFSKVYEKLKIFKENVWCTDKRHTQGKCLLKDDNMTPGGMFGNLSWHLGDLVSYNYDHHTQRVYSFGLR